MAGRAKSCLLFLHRNCIYPYCTSSGVRSLHVVLYMHKIFEDAISFPVRLLYLLVSLARISIALALLYLGCLIAISTRIRSTLTRLHRGTAQHEKRLGDGGYNDGVNGVKSGACG